MGGSTTPAPPALTAAAIAAATAASPGRPAPPPAPPPGRGARSASAPPVSGLGARRLSARAPPTAGASAVSAARLGAREPAGDSLAGRLPPTSALPVAVGLGAMPDDEAAAASRRGIRRSDVAATIVDGDDGRWASEAAAFAGRSMELRAPAAAPAAVVEPRCIPDAPPVPTAAPALASTGAAAASLRPGGTGGGGTTSPPAAAAAAAGEAGADAKRFGGSRRGGGDGARDATRLARLGGGGETPTGTGPVVPAPAALADTTGGRRGGAPGPRRADSSGAPSRSTVRGT